VDTSNPTLRWYPGPPADQERAGKLARVEAAGRAFVVFVIGEDIYALDDRCSHQDESLSQVGTVDDGELECCAHGARFDPGTGSATGLPATAPLATANVRVHDGRIDVG
jgi:3-phenylpropionate/trans-cinnamate dioxygenase ferredoxin subunit